MPKIKRTCPVCIQNGKESTLELKQISFTEAVYICEDRKCIYPIGFQWEFVQNNILEDSDSSEDNFDAAISLPNKSNTNIVNKQTYDLKDKLPIVSDQKKINPINIINNTIIEDPEDLLSKINKKDDVKTNENIPKCSKSIRKSARNTNNKINKTKTQNCTGLPESVVKTAKELSKYFASQDQPENPKTGIRTALDILRQPIKEETKSKAITKNVANKTNTSSINNEINIDNKCLVNVIKDEQEKINNEFIIQQPAKKKNKSKAITKNVANKINTSSINNEVNNDNKILDNVKKMTKKK